MLINHRNWLSTASIDYMPQFYAAMYMPLINLSLSICTVRSPTQQFWALVKSDLPSLPHLAGTIFHSPTTSLFFFFLRILPNRARFRQGRITDVETNCRNTLMSNHTVESLGCTGMSQERSQEIVMRLRSSQTYEHYSVRTEKFRKSFIPFSVNNYQ